MAEFLSPYQMSKVLSGVIPANRVARPNWLQTSFGRVSTTESETVNFDVEFASNNTPAMYVAPTVDAPLIKLQGFGTKEMRFAYVKEGLSAPDYTEINSRQLGQDFGNVNVMANYVDNIRKKLAITEFNFENLFELNASKLILNAAYTVTSALHPTVTYDFDRTTVTTDAGYLAGYVPEIDLTTLVANGGAGKRAWDVTDGTADVTPYKDLIKACQTLLRRGSIRAAVISDDAYAYLEADINTNYKDAATLTYSIESRIEMKVLPEVEMYQDLNFRRSIPIGQGRTIDIYTYSAVYHNRSTGVATAYIPDGYMCILPSPEAGVKVYGRIMHINANYAAMPRYINSWTDPKTGKMESEIHTNYLMGIPDANLFVTWKVL